MKLKISRPMTPSLRKKNPFDPEGNPVFFFSPVNHNIVKATKMASFDERVKAKVRERERNIGNMHKIVRS